MADWIKEYQDFSSQDWKPTTLAPAEEAKFRTWIQGTKLFNSVKADIAAENNLQPEKLDNNKVIDMLSQQNDYDYRGAWKAGVKEVISKHDNRPHWPSSAGDKMLKSPKHETAWKEFFMRQYNKDPDDIGLSTFDQARQWSAKKESTKNAMPTQRGADRSMLMKERLK